MTSCFSAIEPASGGRNSPRWELPQTDNPDLARSGPDREGLLHIATRRPAPMHARTSKALRHIAPRLRLESTRLPELVARLRGPNISGRLHFSSPQLSNPRSYRV